MPGLVATLRRMFGGHPLERMKRVQAVRDEMLEAVVDNSWAWPAVEAAARDVHSSLKEGHVPSGEGEIQRELVEICTTCQKRGYPVEDLREAVDGVKAKAAAKQRLEKQQPEPNRGGPGRVAVVALTVRRQRGVQKGISTLNHVAAGMVFNRD